MKGTEPKSIIKKSVRERFYLEFSAYHCEWMRTLVRQYKERGIFPIFPTQIIEYYPDKADKDIAVFAALCMTWNNETEIQQIATMRKILGTHPFEWFRNREFVTLSTESIRKTAIEGFSVDAGWKIARCYDMLYTLCKRDGQIVLPSKVFLRGNFDTFCESVAQACNIKEISFKGSVAELVLRTSDGIGRSVWGNISRGVKSPFKRAIEIFVAQWFPYWNPNVWSLREVAALMRMEHNYDIFYAWLAYNDLLEANYDACKHYEKKYQTWFENADLRPRYAWCGSRGVLPEIKFKNYE